MNDAEHKLQCACVKWFRYAHHDMASVLFAVPNGGARDAVTGAKLKAEGVVAGVADILLLVPNAEHNALAIEMKTPTGRQSPAQKEWQQAAERVGVQYVVARSLPEFIDAVEKYFEENRKKSTKNVG